MWETLRKVSTWLCINSLCSFINRPVIVSRHGVREFGKPHAIMFLKDIFSTVLNGTNPSQIYRSIMWFISFWVKYFFAWTLSVVFVAFLLFLLLSCFFFSTASKTLFFIALCTVWNKLHIHSLVLNMKIFN